MTCAWYSGVGMAGALCLASSACDRTDKDAVAALATSAMAVGTYHRITIADACRSSKGNLCTTETVTAIEGVKIVDSKVVTFVTQAELPTALRVPEVQWVLQALSPGRTSVRLDARFSDGSLRTSELPVEVRRANRIEAEMICRARATDDQTLVPVGVKTQISARLLDDTRELTGLLPDALSGTGLTQLPGVLERVEYAWVAPSSPGVVTFTAPAFPRFSMRLRTFGRDEMTIDAIRWGRPAPVRVPRNVAAGLEAVMTVGGKGPCYELAVDAQSLTPDICLGPNRETQWQEGGTATLRILPLEAGTCRLSVAVAGSAARREFDVVYDVFDL